jgi:hypothetical protein
MEQATKRATIYFDAHIHKVLRIKAAHTQRSISELVNEAVKMALREDHDDLKAFEDREQEPVVTYEELLAELKANGNI